MWLFLTTECISLIRVATRLQGIYSNDKCLRVRRIRINLFRNTCETILIYARNIT